MTHKNVYMALAAAQSAMTAPIKGAVNPAFKSKYADLADVVAAALPHLTANGIALLHIASRDEHGAVMTTILHHGESDTRIECPIPLIVGKNDMQGYKSATTYAKRIGLESVTGLAPEDDDGNAAAKNPGKPEPKLVNQTLTEDQFRELRDLMEEAGGDESRFLAFFKIAHIGDLSADKFGAASAMLKKKIAQAA
jgi:hypothetical protein